MPRCSFVWALFLAVACAGQHGQDGAAGPPGPAGPKGDPGAPTFSGPATFTGGFTVLSSSSSPVFDVSNSDAFSGYAGSRTSGAPRVTIGDGPFSSDDSALLICRNLVGDSLFSHAVRDESTLDFTTTGAYASYDSIPVMNGTIHYNHFRSFQARPSYRGAGTIDEFSGFNVQLDHQGAGMATNAYGIHVADPSGTGPLGLNAGIRVDPLTRGSSNFGIFVDRNPSFLGGHLQIAGSLTGATTGSFSGEVTANSLDATGTPAAFSPAGGVGVYGFQNNPFGVIKAYSDSSGTEKTLHLNPGGAPVTTGGSITLGAAPFGSLGTPANGTLYFCADCTVGNPCAGGGTGALAKRLNNAWVCN